MIFLTGVPGFLGTRLLRALAEANPEHSFLLLVQPKFEERTHTLLADLGLANRATVLPGDITEPDLGLGERYDAVAEQITRAADFPVWKAVVSMRGRGDGSLIRGELGERRRHLVRSPTYLESGVRRGVRPGRRGPPTAVYRRDGPPGRSSQHSHLLVFPA